MPTLSEPAHLVSAPAADTTQPLQKLIHLQILRAVAASLVVADHTFGSLANRGDAHGQGSQQFGFSGTIGVSAFFILSGLIMMRQSANRFATPRASFVFMVHRIVRIVPMYWLATLLWLASLISWKIRTPHARAQLFYSLFFIPDFLSGLARFKPILQQGWTLNFEMSFYLLFALALFFPRKLGVSMLLSVPLLLIALGFAAHFPITNTVADLRRFCTDPIIWLFSCGVLIGFLEIRRKKLIQFAFPFSPALLLLLPPFLAFVFPSFFSKSVGLRWLGVQFFCAGLVFLCTLVVTPHPGRFTRLLVLLGDASYSTYLFHLWVYVWIIPPIAKLSTSLNLAGNSAVLFVIAAIVAANLLGVIVHLTVERPVTRALRKYTRGVLMCSVRVLR